MKIRNALGILSSEVPVGNLLWVDAVNGMDGLAVRGRMTIPFKTLSKAKDAAQGGDTIVVLPGAYVTSQQLAKAGGGGSHVLEATHSSADVYFQGYGLFGTQSAIKVTAGTNVVVEADLISGDENSAIDVSGGTLAIRARQINSNALHGIKVSGGTLDVDAFQIKSTGGKGIYFNAGTARIRAFEVLATTAPAVEYTYGGTLTILNARLVSQWNNSGGRAVFASGGTSGITLHSCVLISHATGASTSIDVASGSFTVQLHGACTANKAKGSGITTLPLTQSPNMFSYDSNVT